MKAELLLERLQSEQKEQRADGLYSFLQIETAYHSNCMEGNGLSKEKTALLYQNPESTLDLTEGSNQDDSIEVRNHFKAFDYILDHVDEPLSENLIKEIHKILFANTSKSREDWFVPGDYKKRENIVAGHKTASVKTVASRMSKLLQSYHCLREINLEEIVSFHVEFEQIHPFSDGNGRVGRLIAFKECLKNHVFPFLLQEQKRAFYYRGLQQWNREKGFLLGTFEDGQYTLEKLIEIQGLSI